MSTGKRYFISLAYDGTEYHGWQVQPGRITVQAKITEALSLILREEAGVTGAGRTDTGVHARSFTAHFNSIRRDLDRNRELIFNMNSFLPKDIAVTDISEVEPGAHARFNAKSRTYRYYISLKKDPFNNRYAWERHDIPDVDAMNMAASYLLNYDDFTSFSKSHTQVKTNICRLYRAEWIKEGDQLIFTIKADRFLRNMVRAIVGTMVDIGTGKKAAGDIKEIISSRNRSEAGMSAPAKGLFLEEIEYPQDIFIRND